MANPKALPSPPHHDSRPIAIPGRHRCRTRPRDQTTRRRLYQPGQVWEGARGEIYHCVSLGGDRPKGSDAYGLRPKSPCRSAAATA